MERCLHRDEEESNWLNNETLNLNNCYNGYAVHNATLRKNKGPLVSTNQPYEMQA